MQAEKLVIWGWQELRLEMRGENAKCSRALERLRVMSGILREKMSWMYSKRSEMSRRISDAGVALERRDSSTFRARGRIGGRRGVESRLCEEGRE